MQQLALAIEQHAFAAGAKARVDREHGPLAERRGEEQFAEIVGEDLDRGLVGALLRIEAHLGFHRGREQPLGGVLDREGNLRGGGALVFHEERLHLGGRGRFVGELHAHHQEGFFFAAAHREDAVRRRLRERLAPLEVILKLGGLGVGVLAVHDL